jgi:DNA-binding transcriptional LysR family regulator
MPMNVKKMRKVQFAELIEFVAVAEDRSFTRAAGRLGVSTAALSQTIRAVEDRLGLRLLNRTTRHVAPTRAGERLLERLRPVLEGLESTLEELNEYRDRPTGYLHLAIAPAAGHVLGPILARFAAHYPDIKIEISTDAGPFDIISDHFDAGIQLRTDDDMLDRSADTHSNHVISVPVDGTIILNEVELALRTALSGAGLLYLPENCAEAAIAAGALQGVLQAWMPRPSDGFVLYYPSRRQNPAALRCLADFLQENLRRERHGIVSSPEPQLLCA